MPKEMKLLYDLKLYDLMTKLNVINYNYLETYKFLTC